MDSKVDDVELCHGIEWIGYCNDIAIRRLVSDVLYIILFLVTSHSLFTIVSLVNLYFLLQQQLFSATRQIMARGGGIALKSLQLFFRFIQFLCAVVILAIFSYFLATLRNHGLDIGTHVRAVEGISGAAVLYTLIGLGALCFVAGIAFFSVTAILLDLAFMGAFIYVAYQNRGGANSCRGIVSTVFGTGSTDSSNSVPAPNGGSTILPSFRQACQLETACFSVAIVAM